MTDSLPWWATLGTGPGGVMPGGGALGYQATSGGGPNMGYPALGGPTGTPSAAPQGAGGAASAPTGGPPAGVSAPQWLQYLQQFFGISPAMALDHGDGPPDQPKLSDSLTATPVNNQFQTGGPELAAAQAGRPAPAPRAGPTFPARPAGVGPSGTPMGPGSLSPGALAAVSNPNTPMPWRGPMAGDSPANRAAAGGGGPGPLAAAPAAAAAAPAAAAAGNRFIGIDRPNAPAEGGPYGRSSLQGTALNLAGLFNRGQPQAAPAAVPGPLAANARPDLAQRVPLASAPLPPVKPTDIANQQIANALKNPNWWRGFS